MGPARRWSRSIDYRDVYTKLHIEYDQQWAIVVVNGTPHLPRTSAVCLCHQVLSTADRTLSLFISHSPTVGVPWRNFLSPEFESKVLEEVSLFVEIF